MGWEEGDSCHGLLPTFSQSFQAFHIVKDITVMEVPEWQRDILVQAARAKPAVNARAVFKFMITEQHIYEWSGLVTYVGGHRKYTLP